MSCPVYRPVLGNRGRSRAGAGKDRADLFRLGFGHLNPSFGIRSTGNDTTRLPSASSCFNLLKLPEYKVHRVSRPWWRILCSLRCDTADERQDEKTLKAKLLQAITSGAGFDLS